jgi:diguanylate cyclase (GGDEF)-like protein
VGKERILVAEDELHLREVLRLQLENAGFEVFEARDGEQAVEMVRKTLPDLVLLDVMMPRLDGFQVCRDLRSTFATRHIPIILLTAKTEVIDKILGLEGGANDYVTKPWESRELMLRIRNVLEWSRQQRAASPLTGLPGNLSLNGEIARRISAEKAFAMLQIDIDFFKAFNDYYGYTRGDQAIQRMAGILVDATRDCGGPGDFVGHIGGDDFVILTETGTAEAIGARVIAEFNSAVEDLYDPADLKRGYVEVLSRQHVLERVPLMSVTIALVSTDRVPISHLAQLDDIAQELKTQGKGIAGSILVSERRSLPADADGDRSAA